MNAASLRTAAKEPMGATQVAPKFSKLSKAQKERVEEALSAVFYDQLNNDGYSRPVFLKHEAAGQIWYDYKWPDDPKEKTALSKNPHYNPRKINQSQEFFFSSDGKALDLDTVLLGVVSGHYWKVKDAFSGKDVDWSKTKHFEDILSRYAQEGDKTTHTVEVWQEDIVSGERTELGKIQRRKMGRPSYVKNVAYDRGVMEELAATESNQNSVLLGVAADFTRWFVGDASTMAGGVLPFDSVEGAYQEELVKRIKQELQKNAGAEFAKLSGGGKVDIKERQALDRVLGAFVTAEVRDIRAATKRVKIPTNTVSHTNMTVPVTPGKITYLRVIPEQSRSPDAYKAQRWSKLIAVPASFSADIRDRYFAEKIVFAERFVAAAKRSSLDASTLQTLARDASALAHTVSPQAAQQFVQSLADAATQSGLQKVDAAFVHDFMKEAKFAEKITTSMQFAYLAELISNANTSDKEKQAAAKEAVKEAANVLVSDIRASHPKFKAKDAKALVKSFVTAAQEAQKAQKPLDQAFVVAFQAKAQLG